MCCQRVVVCEKLAIKLVALEHEPLCAQTASSCCGMAACAVVYLDMPPTCFWYTAKHYACAKVTLPPPVATVICWLVPKKLRDLVLAQVVC